MKNLLLLFFTLFISTNISAASFWIDNRLPPGAAVIRYEVCIENRCVPQPPVTLESMMPFDRVIDVPPGKVATVIGKSVTWGSIFYFKENCRVEFEDHQQGGFLVMQNPFPFATCKAIHFT